MADFDIGDFDEEEDLAPNLEDEATIQRELEQTRLDVSVALNNDNYVTSMSNLLNQTTVFDPLQLGEAEEASRVDANQTLIATDGGDYVTYEDLCKQHMVSVAERADAQEVFMRGVERFTRETKLTKRVNEWETRIVPMLEEQDKHEDFDIYKNRQSIIEEMKTLKKEEASVQLLSEHKQPYEVSRMFVSLLQMVVMMGESEG